jgi:transcription termination factor Rho
MSKKRFRPRSQGGRGGGGHYGGGGGGGYYQGSNGQGGPGGRTRRRRYYQDRDRDRPPFGGEAAPLPPGELGPDGAPLPEGAVGEGTEFQNPPVTPEQVLEPGYGLLEMHPNGYGFLRSPDTTYTRERSDPFVPGTMIEKYPKRRSTRTSGSGWKPARRR